MLSVCLTPDGQWVMSGSKDRGVQFWDPVTGNAQMMLQGHKNSGESLISLSRYDYSRLLIDGLLRGSSHLGGPRSDR